MITYVKYLIRVITALIFLGVMTLPLTTVAAIDGVTGKTFNFTARPGLVSTPDGNSIYSWGYANAGGLMQYPGPTMIVRQGDKITVNLKNELPVPVSMVFPGQAQQTSTGGTPGLMTNESTSATDTVTYTFVAREPGTYLYQSGTNPALQIEMGLVGALIVRPRLGNNFAYNSSDTRFDHEYLYVLSEMDPEIHFIASMGYFDFIDNTRHNPVLWMINGRAAPDTLADAGVSWLPYQPYNSLSRVRPGETALARIINVGRDPHPFHTHGNHVTIIGTDGRLLQSGPRTGADLAHVNFTVQTIPGATYDALWSWTGIKLGWDIYGHKKSDPLEPGEYAPDHGKPMPVLLPQLQELTFGGFYSGSPFLGAFGDLPPGEGGLNLNGGLYFMWHSHNEKELVNQDVFPGGMMTMMIVEPPGTPIN